MKISQLEKYAFENDIRFSSGGVLYYLKNGVLKNNDGHSKDIDSFELCSKYVSFFYKGYLITMCEPLKVARIPKRIRS